MFGAFRNTYYICHVKRLPLAIRAESREGKPYTSLPNLYFSMPKVLFDYPGKFPAREQDFIDTTPRKRVSIFMMLTYFFYYSLPEK